MLYNLTIDLYAVVKNNTESSHIPFAQVAPLVTSCMILVQLQNLKLTLIQSTNFIQISPVLSIPICMCALNSMQLYNIFRFLWPIESTEQFHHTDLSCYFWKSHSHFSYPYPQPQLLAITNLFIISLVSSFQACYI